MTNQEQEQYIVRDAKESDLTYILEFARMFCELTNYKMTFNRNISWNTLYGFFKDENSKISVVEIGSRVVGVAIYSFVFDWCDKPISYVNKFFIDPIAWGTKAGRYLVKEICNKSEEFGCSHVFVTSTANISKKADKAFENLFGKYNFILCGSTLMKEI